MRAATSLAIRTLDIVQRAPLGAMPGLGHRFRHRHGGGCRLGYGTRRSWRLLGNAEALAQYRVDRFGAARQLVPAPKVLDGNLLLRREKKQKPFAALERLCHGHFHTRLHFRRLCFAASCTTVSSCYPARKRSSHEDFAVVGPLSATREWCIFAVGLRKTNPVYLAPRRGAGLHTTEGVCVRPWSARPADLCSRGAARGTAGGNRFGCARWRSPVRRHLLRRGLLLRADLRAATCSYPRLPIRLRARLSTGRETGMHDPQRTTVSHRDRSGLSVSLGQRVQVGQQVCLQAGIQEDRGGPRGRDRGRAAGPVAAEAGFKEGAAAPTVRRYHPHRQAAAAPATRPNMWVGRPSRPYPPYQKPDRRRSRRCHRGSSA